jgi:hypothetical protein
MDFAAARPRSNSEEVSSPRQSVGLATMLLVLALPASLPVRGESRTLSFEDRVGCQWSIDGVYWRHRTWPAANPGVKPGLEEVLTNEAVSERVTSYLEKSAVLESWSRPLTGEQLQAEMDRMAAETRNPELLAELFAALDDDPFLVAECLARPLLAQRLVRTAIEWDEPVVAGSVPAPSGGYVLPSLPSGGCTEDSWRPTSTGPGVPAPMSEHTAVWTGAEMIVWGTGGGRYDPATDGWTPLSTGPGAPSSRTNHTAVWTGREMIVWGGREGPWDDLNTGARYDPTTDRWAATSSRLGKAAGTGVPVPRAYHTAVWTGREMIVWGGISHLEWLRNSGGRYDPATDSWTTVSARNAPSARMVHTAIWTGRDMIVWGGYPFTQSGGRYDPVTDTWQATSTDAGVPSARYWHTAVWTGREMIVWGGLFHYPYSCPVDGGRYDPWVDAWIPTSTAAGMPAPRWGHTAVWTGSEMIVWGGGGFDSGIAYNGGRYDPAADSWTETSTGPGVPSPRYFATAVWTGSEMIVWGGGSNTGGLYCP